MTANITTNFLVPTVLCLVCAGIAFATLTGKSLPLISTPRAALIALLIVGLAACMGGIGQVGASGRWASPLAILGYLLGAVILLVIIAPFAGWKLPYVQSENQAVITVVALMAVKYLIGATGFFFHLL